MIPRPEWYAFLIMAGISFFWLLAKLDKILSELKALREEVDKK
jgi:prolipoprotein diacylglyceryltransferase